MKVIIVTGLSGAGKTKAMDCLEDLGYYCVDNMPPSLIKNFIELVDEKNIAAGGYDKAAFVVDVRGGSLFDDLRETLDYLKSRGVDYKILYLEASNMVLAKRFNEVRRQHPLSEGGSVSAGLKKERKQLRDIRLEADFVIDTSNLSLPQLNQEIIHAVTSNDSKTFIINIVSFGYKNGTPIAAEMVFDVRFIPNPFYIKSLKELTGNNKKVAAYVLKFEVTQVFIEDVINMLEKIIPSYMKEGKFSLMICFGCTGGKHRSVAIANEVNRRLRDKGYRTIIEHREQV